MHSVADRCSWLRLVAGKRQNERVFLRRFPSAAWKRNEGRRKSVAKQRIVRQIGQLSCVAHVSTTCAFCSADVSRKVPLHSAHKHTPVATARNPCCVCIYLRFRPTRRFCIATQCSSVEQGEAPQLPSTQLQLDARLNVELHSVCAWRNERSSNVI